MEELGPAPALSLGADRVSQLSLSPLWQGLAPPHPMDFHLLSEEWNSQYCSCVPVARTPAVRNVSLGLRLGAWFLWDVLSGRGWSCLKRHVSVQDTGRGGERRWFVMQIPTMRMSKPGGCLGKGDGFFFLRFCSEQNSWCSESLCVMWFVIFAVWTQWLLSSVHRLVSSSWWAVTLRSLKLGLTEGSALCSLCFFSIYQILAKFSCYSSCMNRMFSQPLLLEEDEIIHCMSEILWSKLLSTKIQVLFNTGTGILHYRSLFF